MTPTNKSYNVEEGSSVIEITCACGNCEPRCLTQWLAGGEVIGNTSSLQISNVSRADSRTYTCQCLNPSTMIEEKSELKISVNRTFFLCSFKVSIPGLATYFRFSFRFFKKGSCQLQLLAKVCARSTG